MNFVPMHDDEFVFSWGFMIKIVWGYPVYK